MGLRGAPAEDRGRIRGLPMFIGISLRSTWRSGDSILGWVSLLGVLEGAPGRRPGLNIVCSGYFFFGVGFFLATGLFVTAGLFAFPITATFRSCAGTRCLYRNACIMSSAGTAFLVMSFPLIFARPESCSVTGSLAPAAGAFSVNLALSFFAVSWGPFRVKPSGAAIRFMFILPSKPSLLTA